MEQSPSWETNRLSASQEIPHVMEAEVSWTQLQVPATCPYPEHLYPFPIENKKKTRGVFLSVVWFDWVNTIQTLTRTANLTSAPIRCKIIP
jgi:hypothetical protein